MEVWKGRPAGEVKVRSLRSLCKHPVRSGFHSTPECVRAFDAGRGSAVGPPTRASRPLEVGASGSSLMLV